MIRDACPSGRMGAWRVFRPATLGLQAEWQPVFRSSPFVPPAFRQPASSRHRRTGERRALPLHGIAFVSRNLYGACLQPAEPIVSRFVAGKLADKDVRP